MTQTDKNVAETSRRRFCAHACQAAAFLAAGVVTGCGGGGSPSGPSGASASPLPMVSATTSGRVISISLTEATALASVGGAAIVDTSLGTYLVAKTGESAYTALIATCTHEGSPITAYNGSRFVCLTHGSQYTTTGTVAVGPATRSLSSYPTQVNGTTLTITV